MAAGLVWSDYVRFCYARGKGIWGEACGWQTGASLTGKHTLFLLNLFSSKPHLLLFPSCSLYLQFILAPILCPLVFTSSPPPPPFSVPLIFEVTFSVCPSVNSSLSIWYSLLFLFPSPQLPFRLIQWLCHLLSFSIFLFSHSSFPSGVSSSLSVWCFSCIDTASVLTLAVTPCPLKSPFPPFSMANFLVQLLIHPQN